MKFRVLKMNQVSLVPDKYGSHIRIKQLTEFDEFGDYVKHIPLTKETIEDLKGSFILRIPKLWYKDESGHNYIVEKTPILIRFLYKFTTLLIERIKNLHILGDKDYAVSNET